MGWHTPETHASFALQALPQLPQCCGSMRKSVQTVAVPTVQALGTGATQLQLPPEQICPAAHWLPQAPQFCASELTLVQKPWPPPVMQALGCAAPQLVTQPPAEQSVPAAHTVLQLPQWSGSVWKLVQIPLGPLPHALGAAAGHWQAPTVEPPGTEQLCPPGHCMPQPPQLASSLWVSTHTPLQNALAGSWQVLAHTPAEHTWPAGHFIPHALQLSGSFCRLAQYPVAPEPQGV
jgi:hypothetical protein